MCGYRSPSRSRRPPFVMFRYNVTVGRRCRKWPPHRCCRSKGRLSHLELSAVASGHLLKTTPPRWRRQPRQTSPAPNPSNEMLDGSTIRGPSAMSYVRPTPQRTIKKQCTSPHESSVSELTKTSTVPEPIY